MPVRVLTKIFLGYKTTIFTLIWFSSSLHRRIYDEPDEEKYYRIYIKGTVFERYVWQLEGAEKFLQFLGWIKVSDVFFFCFFFLQFHNSWMRVSVKKWRFSGNLEGQLLEIYILYKGGCTISFHGKAHCYKIPLYWTFYFKFYQCGTYIVLSKSYPVASSLKVIESVLR